MGGVKMIHGFHVWNRIMWTTTLKINRNARLNRNLTGAGRIPIFFIAQSAAKMTMSVNSGIAQTMYVQPLAIEGRNNSCRKEPNAAKATYISIGTNGSNHKNKKKESPWEGNSSQKIKPSGDEPRPHEAKLTGIRRECGEKIFHETCCPQRE
jgi:hypothetical protein